MYKSYIENNCKKTEVLKVKTCVKVSKNIFGYKRNLI